MGQFLDLLFGDESVDKFLITFLLSSSSMFSMALNWLISSASVSFVLAFSSEVPYESSKKSEKLKGGL